MKAETWNTAGIMSCNLGGQLIYEEFRLSSHTMVMYSPYIEYEKTLKAGAYSVLVSKDGTISFRCCRWTMILGFFNCLISPSIQTLISCSASTCTSWH